MLQRRGLRRFSVVDACAEQWRVKSRFPHGHGDLAGVFAQLVAEPFGCSLNGNTYASAGVRIRSVGVAVDGIRPFLSPKRLFQGVTKMATINLSFSRAELLSEQVR